MDNSTDLIRTVKADQKWNHIRDRLSSSDPDLIGCSYGKIHYAMQDGNFLPNIIPKEVKSSRLSVELRNQGSVAYTQTKDNKAAIQLYTKAICAALPNSKEIALAYANRSAVTYDIGLEFLKQTRGQYAFKGFHDSVKDIDRALSSGSYPDHLKYKLYKRRGLCLKNQGKNSEALDDFKLARTHVMNSRLSRGEVESFLSEIDTLLKPPLSQPSPPQHISSFPSIITLSCEPSSYIDCASSAVDITYTPKMGRGVVTNRDIFPGDVLAIEKHYASALFPEFSLNHCDNCTEICLSPIPCTSCSTLVYCSEKCRQSSWASYHRVECRILPSLLAYFSASLNVDLVLEMNLALRLFLIASKCGEDLQKLLKEEPIPADPSKCGFVGGMYLSNDYTSVHHLYANLEDYGDDFKVMFIGHGIALMCLLWLGTTFFENLDSSSELKQSDQCCLCDLTPIHLTVTNLLLKFRMIVQMNSVKVVDPYDETGIAIYPFFSLVNHSCDANVRRMPYGGDTIFIMAVQTIPKGQQVLRNYRVDFKFHPRSLRREQLRRCYLFKCDCPPCVENWPIRLTWLADPIFTLTHQANSILILWSIVDDAFELISSGKGHFGILKQLVWFMNLVFENVKLPWEPYTKAQEAIELFMVSQANPELLILFCNDLAFQNRKVNVNSGIIC